MKLQDVLNNLVIVLHNVTSVHRVIEVCKIVFGFGIKNFILSKVSGAAAQQGIPEVFKIGMKYNANIAVLPDLKDVTELLKPIRTYLLTFEQCNFKLQDLIQEIKELSSGNVLLVINGLDTTFTPKESELGKLTQVIDRNIPSTGLLTITLFKIFEQLEK